jgi:WD40 repeat protein
VAVTPNGGTVAQVTTEGKAHIWDVATAKKIWSVDLECKEEPRGLNFINGQQLLIWTNLHTIKVYSIRTRTLSRVPLRVNTLPAGIGERERISQLNVSPDGRILAVTHGKWLSTWKLNGGTLLGIIEVAKSESDIWWTRPEFTPDSQFFAWPEEDGTIQLYRTATLEKVRCLGKTSRDGRVENARFSWDGKTLAALTRRRTIRVLEVATGRELREIGDESRQPSREGRWWLLRDDDRPDPARLAWSANSKVIAQAREPGIIRLWDIDTGKGNDAELGHIGPVSGLLVSEDGASAVTLGVDNTVRRWDVPTATERRKRSLPAMTDFGILLDPRRALLQSLGDSLCVWDIEKGQELFKVHSQTERVGIVRYTVYRGTPSLLALEMHNYLPQRYTQQATLYNLETGVECRGVERKWTREREDRNLRDEEQLMSVVHCSEGPAVATIAVRTWRADQNINGIGHRFLLRCKQSESNSVVLWESKETEVNDTWRAISFTPDDRAVLTFIRSGEKIWVSLLESATGNERFCFRLPNFENPRGGWWVTDLVPHPVYAFSRDGDLVALGTADGTTTIIDIRRSRVVTALHGNQGSVSSLAFGADSGTLFTAGSDGTVLVWDIRRHIRKALRLLHPSPTELERLWAELADPDTGKAYRSVGSLVEAPVQALELFCRKLKPIEKVSALEIDKLITNLDNTNFKRREKAFRDLLQIGPQARAALTKSLKRSDTLELRRRVENLLGELNRREALTRNNTLRDIRAVEVLETIRTPEALLLLQSLAKGATGTPLTEAAQDAFKRLDSAEKGGRNRK